MLWLISLKLSGLFFLQVVELVGKENVKLNKKQIDEIVDLMSKEGVIELEEQIEKALEKGNQKVEEALKKEQSVKEEKEATGKANVISQDDRKKAGEPGCDISASSSSAAMSAAPPTQPHNVSDPTDKKDNSKTL
jgi:LETM1 and EF-hand domain-containing protein 1